jgi:predicted esterase
MAHHAQSERVRADVVGGRQSGARHADLLRRLAVLREAGADVTLRWQPDGHTLSPREVDEARRWLAP